MSDIILCTDHLQKLIIIWRQKPQNNLANFISECRMQLEKALADEERARRALHWLHVEGWPEPPLERRGGLTYNTAQREVAQMQMDSKMTLELLFYVGELAKSTIYQQLLLCYMTHSKQKVIR